MFVSVASAAKAAGFFLSFKIYRNISPRKFFLGETTREDKKTIEKWLFDAIFLTVKK